MKTSYFSFLFRLWTSDLSDKDPVWRFSLENPKTGKKRSFSSLQEMVTYIESLTKQFSASNCDLLDLD